MSALEAHAGKTWGTRALAVVLLASVAATAAHGAGLEVAEEAGGIDKGPERYAEALEAGPARGGFERNIGAELVTFNSAETDALVASGWQPPARAQLDDFADHGERVRTFVAIAQALGLDPAIGAEQANWGTPQENGLREMAQALDSARYADSVARYDLAALTRHREDAAAVLAQLEALPPADGGGESTAATIAALAEEIAAVDRQLAATEARAAALEAEIVAIEARMASALAHVSPIQSRPPGWELANLDVNGDGAVNQGDLEAALAGVRPEARADGDVDG